MIYNENVRVGERPYWASHVNRILRTVLPSEAHISPFITYCGASSRGLWDSLPKACFAKTSSTQVSDSQKLNLSMSISTNHRCFGNNMTSIFCWKRTSKRADHQFPALVKFFTTFFFPPCFYALATAHQLGQDLSCLSQQPSPLQDLMIFGSCSLSSTGR